MSGDQWPRMGARRGHRAPTWGANPPNELGGRLLVVSDLRLGVPALVGCAVAAGVPASGDLSPVWPGRLWTGSGRSCWSLVDRGVSLSAVCQVHRWGGCSLSRRLPRVSRAGTSTSWLRIVAVVAV